MHWQSTIAGLQLLTVGVLWGAVHEPDVLDVQRNQDDPMQALPCQEWPVLVATAQLQSVHKPFQESQCMAVLCLLHKCAAAAVLVACSLHCAVGHDTSSAACGTAMPGSQTCI